MFSYVARQPIFNGNKEIFAYELLFRNGEHNCFPDIPPDEATSKILASTHLGFGLEEVTGNKPAFINFHSDTLISCFPTSLDNKSVVIEIVETVNVTDELVAACESLKRNGYTLALDDYDLHNKWERLFPFISLVKIDISQLTEAQSTEVIARLKAAKLKIVVERIETDEQFVRYKDLGADYFQGYFFARPEIVKHRKLSPSAMNMLELIEASASADFNIDKVDAIIQLDPSLSYLLLRFINNPLFDKRQEIASLRHALNYLGEVEVKKFIALLALANLSEGQPKELLNMALIRARFCSLVSIRLNEPENPPTGFLTGLLSLLDAMMEQKMKVLMQKIPVANSVKMALTGHPGLLKDCLDAAICFESANWQGVKRFAEKLGVKQVLLHSCYNDAMKWAMKMSASVK